MALMLALLISTQTLLQILVNASLPLEQRAAVR
jgi:hypothetical protein